MIRLSEQQIANLEHYYDGITEQINSYEEMALPAFPRCGSDNTAVVEVGFVGRLNAIAAATSKVTMVMNLPRPGKYRCRACKTFFDEE